MLDLWELMQAVVMVVRVGCDDGNIFAKMTLLTKIPTSSDGSDSSDEVVMRQCWGSGSYEIVMVVMRQ